MIRVTLVRLVVEHLYVTLHVTCPPVVIVTVAKGAWFLEIDFFELGVTLDVVDMARVLISPQFHLE